MRGIKRNNGDVYQEDVHALARALTGRWVVIRQRKYEVKEEKKKYKESWIGHQMQT